jgi:hypothetical protein
MVHISLRQQKGIGKKETEPFTVESTAIYTAFFTLRVYMAVGLADSPRAHTRACRWYELSSAFVPLK